MLTIKIKSSKLLLLFFSVLYSGAITILLLSPLVSLLKISGIIFCLTGFYGCLGKNLSVYLPGVITQAWYTKEGKWLVLTSNSQLYQATLSGNSYVSSCLLILIFKLPASGKTLSALLAFDAYNQHEFRRLRVALQTINKIVA